MDVCFPCFFLTCHGNSWSKGSVKTEARRTSYTELCCSVVSFYFTRRVVGFLPLGLMAGAELSRCAALRLSTLFLGFSKPSRIAGSIYKLLCQLPKGSSTEGMEFALLRLWESWNLMGVESISAPMHLDWKQKPFPIAKTTFSSSHPYKMHPDYRTNGVGERDVPLRFMNLLYLFQPFI